MTIDLSQLGTGLYSRTEAARLLRTYPQTLDGWVKGYVHQLRTGPKEYGPVVPLREGSPFTFADLVELLYVKAFREAQVPLDEIRKTAIKYRKEWDTPYPLASKQFIHNGKKLLIKENEVWKQALTGQFAILIDELSSRFEHVGDLVGIWRPLGANTTVELNPARSFGKPIESASGAHTYVFSQALAGGSSVSEVAWWYEVSEQSVRDADEFERIWKKVRSSEAA